ncbi:DUF4388 domain-containing protein [Fibrobacterales bacterium]|nr:DUF4388 domain-containing protein [Fibrobacterales bacterium]
MILVLGCFGLVQSMETTHIKDFGKLLRKPVINAPIVTLLNDKREVKIIFEKGNWVEVQTEGYRGWILREQTQLKPLKNELDVLLDSMSNKGANSESRFTSIISISLVFVSLFSSLFWIRKNLKKKRNPATDSIPNSLKSTTIAPTLIHSNQSPLQVLIFSQKDKSVASKVSNVHKRLSICFKDLGFGVSNSETIKNVDLKNAKTPKIIMVDLSLERKPLKSIEKLFETLNLSEKIPVILYNAENPSEVDSGKKLSHVYILGQHFTDQDILKIVEKVVKKAERKDPHIFQGLVTNEGIYEILQLIELGNKTGILKLKTNADKLYGELSFEFGQIVYARTAKCVGEEAATQLLGSKVGHFAFYSKSVQNRNCLIQPTHLMLNVVKQQDEKERDNQPHIGDKYYEKEMA